MACGQNNPPSIKALDSGGLSPTNCRNFSQGSGAERPVAAWQSPVSECLAGAGANISRLATVAELLSSVRGQAASR